MLPIILYPCEYGNIYKIDECYKFEREVAKELGFVTYLFNYDDFVNGCELKINTGLENNICLNTVVYRGWMLKIEDYKRLYEELLPLSLVLINNPKQYENTHHFINSYPILELYTPKTLFFKKGELIDWNLVRNTFQNKFIVKDYVKSVKGFAFPEYLECSMSNEELDNYIKKFIEFRGDLYQGGIALKEYVKLDKTNGITHEFRVFYIREIKKVVYPINENETEILPGNYGHHPLNKLKSNFYSMDFAKLENGTYMPIEIGDGQVSGLPSKKEAELLYKALYYSLK